MQRNSLKEQTYREVCKFQFCIHKGEEAQTWWFPLRITALQVEVHANLEGSLILLSHFGVGLGLLRKSGTDKAGTLLQGILHVPHSYLWNVLVFQYVQMHHLIFKKLTFSVIVSIFLLHALKVFPL